MFSKLLCHSNNYKSSCSAGLIKEKTWKYIVAQQPLSLSFRFSEKWKISQMATIFGVCGLFTWWNEFGRAENWYALDTDKPILYTMSNQIRYHCQIWDAERRPAIYHWKGEIAANH